MRGVLGDGCFAYHGGLPWAPSLFPNEIVAYPFPLPKQPLEEILGACVCERAIPPPRAMVPTTRRHLFQRFGVDLLHTGIRSPESLPRLLVDPLPATEAGAGRTE